MKQIQGLSLKQNLALQQKLMHALRTEMRQELRLAMKQLLRLLQSIQISLDCMTGLKHSDAKLLQSLNRLLKLHASDWVFIAERLGVRGNTAWSLAEALVMIGRWDHRYDDLAQYGAFIQHRILEEDHHCTMLQRQAEVAPAIALRIVLRDPRWFGGGGSDKYDLWSLLKGIPQRGRAIDGGSGKSDEPRLSWVLAGGWAVELLTGVTRDHHDIDTLVLSRKPMCLDTDVVTPSNYFDVLSTTGEFIRRHCVLPLDWKYKEKTRRVWVLKPEFLFCSKFIRPPRPQDWQDVKTLVHHFSATWDLKLIRELCKKQACGFTRATDLLKILASRDPERIIYALSTFHEEEAYDIAS
ncbi:hypothetical protein GF380_05985 [Candidatus Uhrbacteria bacterium]|nr:hypothetical protein [Candidatus Uhrbacteria bacterium]MBD3284689.1 hypothetical protein [Candidatus Uhrbacteria bacterium]